VSEEKRIVRLRDLTQAQRDVVMALIHAAESAKNPYLSEKDKKWQARLAEAQAEADARRQKREERLRQRNRLREGHKTLTQIRRLLAQPGAQASLPLESEPETNSQT
jgi:Spy/CpxP family protein refolding chaperone